MITLSDGAKRSLEDYLRQARAYLRGSKSVDAGEVEQSISEHIENELEGVTEPVSRDELDAVLTQLGSPQQWVPEEGLSLWRKVVLRLRTGPEDWRLAYLSFSLLLLGFLFFLGSGRFFVMAAASFVVSRAALSAAGSHDELGAQKWLIYPSLIFAYLFIGFLLLFGVAFPAVYLARSLWEIEEMRQLTYMGSVLFTGGVIAVATAFWWTILGIAWYKWPALVRNIFTPFAEAVSRRWAVGLICIGLGVLILSLAVLTWLRVAVFSAFK